MIREYKKVEPQMSVYGAFNIVFGGVGVKMHVIGSPVGVRLYCPSTVLDITSKQTILVITITELIPEAFSR